MGLFSSGKSRKQRDAMRSYSDLSGSAAEKYVDSHGDLAAAWAEIKANSYGMQERALRLPRALPHGSCTWSLFSFCVV